MQHDGVVEYQQFVTENHNLIYAFLKANDLDVEEYYDVAAIGLCKAAQAYDESKGFMFSTFAYQCMRNEWWRLGRRLLSRNPDGVKLCSLSRFEDGDEDRIKELCDRVDFTEYIESEADAERFIRSLNECEAHILRSMIDGKSTYEIAKDLGYTHQWISCIVKKIRKKYNVVVGLPARKAVSVRHGAKS